MADDDDGFDRAWRAAQDALRVRLRAFLAGRRTAISLDRDQAWIALCALDGLTAIEPEHRELRRRYQAIDRTYAATRKAEAALDAGNLPSRGDPRAKKRKMLVHAYQRMIGGTGRAGFSSHEYWPEVERSQAETARTGEPQAVNLEGKSITVDRPQEPADAVRLLAPLFGYKTATSCLRALERERSEAGADFPLPQALDL